MPIRKIIISNEGYYFYKTYEDRDEAWEEAKTIKKNEKCKYFILTREKGELIGSQEYHDLYFNIQFGLW